MGKWNKKWDNTCDNDEDITDDPEINELKKKMRKRCKIRRDNPKQIVEFEDIYERPQPSNIREGFSATEDAKKIDPPKIKAALQNLSKQGEGIGQGTASAINKLSAELSNTFDSLNDLGDLNFNLEDLFKDAGNPFDEFSDDTFAKDFKENTKGIKEAANEVSNSMLSVSKMLTNVFKKIGSYIRMIKIQIMLLLLRSNRYIKTLITNIANALTSNTATNSEITTFQEQTQKFVTILMTWFFVYNWYYIVFFLEDSDNVRYTFNTDALQGKSKVLYGMFGPAFRSIEWINYLIIGFGKKIKEWKILNAFVMFFLFVIFFILVHMNFQTSILTNFFSAMSGRYSLSLLTLFTIIVVAIYSLSFLFGSPINNNLSIQSWISSAATGGVFSMCFFIVLTILFFIMYVMWASAVNIPLGILLVSTYFVVYSFMGVFVYEGFNCFNIIAGINDTIDTIKPDLEAEACKPEFEWSKIPRYIYDWTSRMITYASVNMFEIIIILTLLGGIGVYRKQWTTAAAGKVGSIFSGPFSIQESFKHLFTWLILINVLIVILMCMNLYNKYKIITGIASGGDGITDITKTDQTMRSRMAALNNSGPYSMPVMNESKVNKRMLDVNATILPNNITPNPLSGAAIVPVPSITAVEKGIDSAKNITTDPVEKGVDAVEKDTTVPIPTNVAGDVNASTNAAGGAGKQREVP